MNRISTFSTLPIWNALDGINNKKMILMKTKLLKKFSKMVNKIFDKRDENMEKKVTKKRIL